MPDNEIEAVRFSQGRKNFGKVKNKVLPWRNFKGLFKDPTRTNEKYREFAKMPEAEQRALKSVNGYWMRAQNEGGIRRRNHALPSDLISFDLDYTSPEFFEKARKGLLLPGTEHFIHTSRRHTTENPRFRLVIFNAEEIPNEWYPAVSRILAQRIDPEMKHVDPVSFRPAQMMFLPTVSKDGEYVFEEFAGERFDWRTMLAEWKVLNGDWMDVSRLPKNIEETVLRQGADKAEDPTLKDGPVGHFCRAYDIPTAIEEFDLPYEPVDAPSAKPRYTYTGGTTVNGAEVQDGGLFLYSHHGSDPASDRLVNAFDLVRIHKFGKKDEGFDEEGKSPFDFPSNKAMMEFIESDKGYQRQRLEDRYDTEAMFDDLWDEDQIEIEQVGSDEAIERFMREMVVGDGSGHSVPKLSDDDIESDYPDTGIVDTSKPVERPILGVDHQKGIVGITDHGTPYLKKPRPRRAKPGSEWMAELEVNAKTGDIINNVANISLIVSHDTRLRDAIGHNEFTQRQVMPLPIRHKINHLPQFPVLKSNEISGQPWNDSYDALIRIILETQNGPGKSGWGLRVTDRDLREAVTIASKQNTFHPIREALRSFEHDGLARVETLFIKYLGCPDDEYHRETARLFMIAAVARIMEPGCKFDYAPVLVGGQGIGKSTFVETLSMGWFGELSADFSNDQKLAEQMLGCWIMEMAELVSMTRSEVEPAKQFLSGRSMTVRMAYDRHPTEYPRQTVFMGTTNNPDFLKDDTGNRRFWVIQCGNKQIDIVKLRTELAQLWAEAVAMYDDMRSKHPYGDLPLFLQSESSRNQAKELQEAALRPSEADTLAERIKPILDRKIVADDFENVNSGGVPGATRRMKIGPATIMEELGDSRISTQMIAIALQKLGWRKTGRRERVNSRTHPISIYEPGPAQIERWQWEDEDEAISDLI